VKQRGRQSADTLLTTVTGIPTRPEAPERLTGRQKVIWRETVMSKAPGWWDSGNLPLLASYVCAVEELERVNLALSQLSSDVREAMPGRYNGLIANSATLTKTVLALSRAQRLNQSAQYHPRTAAAKSLPPYKPKPWEFEP
jgi:hypothetical protein